MVADFLPQYNKEMTFHTIKTETATAAITMVYLNQNSSDEAKTKRVIIIQR